jgi:Omp85 superfamily domain
MMKKLLFILSILLTGLSVKAQYGKIITQDSVVVKVHPAFDKAGKFHRFLFGENYRKEWAIDTKLPVFRISELHGGLTPERLGGGFQTTSLRLIDPSGKEWVLRSVEKDPVKLLPAELKQTFARDWLIDAMSAQHPYSALIVPPLAEAAGIPHTVPTIGVVSPDKNLGEFNEIFAGKVCLLEEREPTGGSESTLKTMTDLYNDNDYSVDGKGFLKARCLDVLIGDWDRHDDNWRFTLETNNKNRIYTAVPRDRDQVMYINQGLIPWTVSRSWIVPYLQGFGGQIRDIRLSLYISDFMDRYPSVHLGYAEWMKVVNDFVAAETDDVLEAGLKRLPQSAYKLRHDTLLKELKQRRNSLPAAMSFYYRYVNRIIDLHVSNKDEQIIIKDTADNVLTVAINKMSKKGNVKEAIFNGTFDPQITKEIRFYMGAGNDQVILNNNSSPIKLRFIDSLDRKDYNIIKSVNKVQIYDKSRQNLSFIGDSSRSRLHLSKDSANTSFLPINLFNVWMPLADAQINKDDGFLFGLGFRYIGRDGFRAKPYSEIQELLITHSFATKAFDIKYKGEWIQAVGNADILLQANVRAPNNTINFFGLGNESLFVKTGDYVKYYRTRFNTYLLDPALRWRSTDGLSFSVGPSFQYYHFNPQDNVGRFINNTSLIHSYDSLTVAKDKMHAGVTAIFINDRRNNKLLPTDGSYINLKVQSDAGLNGYSKRYTQITGEASFYVHFADTVITISERVGGGATFGNAAFYQSLFLGGQGNLLGYRQYRFAGQEMLFNNVEARIKLLTVASYVLPGELGLTGFFDTGRVWVDGENSDKWHTGTGGGIYFMPAGLTLIQVIAGHSTEGWYPEFSLQHRF